MVEEGGGGGVGVVVVVVVGEKSRCPRRESS